VVRGLRDQGVAVAYISHHLDEVLGLADCVTVMRDGRVVGRHASVQGVSPATLVSQMVGRDLGAVPRHARMARPAAPALTVRGLKVPRAILGLDFELWPGEVLGIAGLPDSGKDVLAEALFGLRVRLGRVDVGGTVLPPLAPRRAIAMGLALVPADRRQGGALLAMSVAQNVVSASLPRLTRLGLLRGRAVRVEAGAQTRRLDARISGLGSAWRRSRGQSAKGHPWRGLATSPRVSSSTSHARRGRGRQGRDLRDPARPGRGRACDPAGLLGASGDRHPVAPGAGDGGGRVAAQLEGEAIGEEAVMAAATSQAEAA
jgi:ABC-type sugar transport system ATPase subunit